MPTRSRKQEKEYFRYKRTHAHKKGCDFCVIDKSFEHFVRETKSFKVIKNIFPYSAWDDQDVVEHLLVVPKRHVVTLDELSGPEAIEYIGIIASYESKGYNVYLRAPQSSIKSVPHQHAHFIKPGKRTHKVMFVLRRPYLRIVR